MPRWLYAMLVFGPLAVAARVVGAPDLLVFAAAGWTAQRSRREPVAADEGLKAP